MDLLSLRLFINVAKLASITAAARDLDMSPASASARLVKLEETAGFRLFHRTTRAVSLTTDGAAFLPYAKQVMETLEAGLHQASGRKTQPRGTLRVAMPGSFGRMHVLPILGMFQSMYPDIQLDLRLSDQIHDVVEGAFDLIVRNARLADSSLVARKLAEDKRIIVASPDYIRNCGAPRKPEEIPSHNCINLQNNLRWEFENGQVIHTPGHYQADDGEAIRMMIEAGMGIGMKSIWNAHSSLKSGKLIQVLPDYPLKSETSIWALYPSGRLLAPKVRVMLDYLVQHFQPTPPWEDESGLQGIHVNRSPATDL